MAHLNSLFVAFFIIVIEAVHRYSSMTRYLQVLFYQDYDYDMNEFDAFVAAFEQKTLDMGITKYREHESMASFLAGVKST